MKSYKHLFSRALDAAPGRLHFAAHSHHLWPDASYAGHIQAWDDAAAFTDKKWDKVFGEVMQQAQACIAAELKLPDPRTIAFATNTHELIERLFSAREPGRIQVLTSDGEFHSFRRQCARWVDEGRVTCRVVPCEPFATFTQRFIDAMHQYPPDIAFVSHVMFRSGLRFDGIEDIARLATPDGTWVVLDIYHSFMAFPSSFSRVADRVFILGGGYKYAMAGEGAAFLHAPDGFAPRPAYTGWFADFGAIEAKQGAVGYASDGGRFLGATYDPSGLYRFNAVQEMLRKEGISTEAIASRVDTLRTDLKTAIKSGAIGPLHEAELLQPNSNGPQARFLALRHQNAGDWKARLSSADVITDARDDVLRIGLGLYHDRDDIVALCDAAKRAFS